MAFRVAAFDLHEPIARGGMGEVWRATHVASGAPAAVKVLTTLAAREPGFVAAFRHEVHAVAALDHPNVVAVYDQGTLPTGLSEALVADSPWLAMEWAPGGSLRPLRGRLRWPALRALFDALLAALAHAHARGVVHCDLKPGNVLVGPDARILLADFGISHVLRDRRGPALLRSTGTPPYMAPEQFDDDRSSIGPWTDLYALGCLAFSLATGHPPFRVRKDPVELRRLHEAGAIPRLTAVVPVPVGFEAWVRALLAKHPADRPAHAADAAAALGELVGEVPARGRARAVDPEADTRVRPSLAGEDTVPLIQSAARPPPARQAKAPTARRPFPARADDAPRARPWFRDAGLGVYGVRTVPLVGRDEERARLWDALGAVITDRAPRAVLLRGASGFGKSRLAEWLVQRAEEGGFARGRVGLEAKHEGSAAERHAAERLALGALDRPAVLWLDDVQGDADALRFTIALLDAADPPPVLAVLTVLTDALEDRPEATALLADLARRGGVEEIEVGPLPPRDRRRLVGELLGLEGELAAAVEERTAGNALFAVQLVASWVEAGALAPGPGGWTLTDPALARVPDGIHALWAGRVEHLLAGLPESDRTALEVACALGQEPSSEEWSAACDRLELPPCAALADALVRSGLASPRPSGLAFVHGMLRESVLRSARGREPWPALNGACADVLRERGASADRVGHHLLASGAQEAALAPLLEGARELVRSGDYGRAEQILVEREGALAHLGVPPEDPRWGTGWVVRAWLLRMGFRLPEAQRWATRARDAAEAHGWDGVLARALSELSRIFQDQGLIAAALPLARRAEALARIAGDVELATACLSTEGDLQLAARDLDAAEGAFLRLLEAGTVAATAYARFGLGRVARARGRSEEARALLEAAREGFATSGARWGVASVTNSLGVTAEEQGQTEEAIGWYRASITAYNAIGSARVVFPEENLAVLLVRLGRYAEAARLASARLDAMARSGLPPGDSSLFGVRACCSAAAGSFDAVDADLVVLAHQMDETPTDALRDLCRQCGTELVHRGEPIRALRFRELSG